MKLIDKSAGGEPVHMPWDAAQAALAGGGYDAHPIEGPRDLDQPAAQMPAPGADPIGGPAKPLEEGQTLPNLRTVETGTAPDGLPKELKVAPSQPAKAAPKADAKPDAKDT